MTHHTTPRTGRRGRRLLATAAVAGVLTAGLATGATALVQPGTNNNDITVGGDNDNADNTFIQPPGVAAKQHMDNTDVLFGRGKDDLLIGKLGSDTLLGGSGSDILVGGPEKFAAPNSDVLVGDTGNDINIWAPGDGSDAFVGNENYDTMIFAPFVEKSDGSLLLSSYGNRKVPRVDIDEKPNFTCTIVYVPKAQNLGFQFLVRFNVNGVPAVTVRQKDVEKVFCPSPAKGKAKVAYLNTTHPQFRDVWLSQVPGTVGAILKPTVW